MKRVRRNIIDEKTCQTILNQKFVTLLCSEIFSCGWSDIHNVDSTFRIGPRMPVASPGEEASGGMTFTAGSASGASTTSSATSGSTSTLLVVPLVLCSGRSDSPQWHSPVCLSAGGSKQYDFDQGIASTGFAKHPGTQGYPGVSRGIQDTQAVTHHNDIH